MTQFVYWMMRYFTTHDPIVRTFGRSPWRNAVVGREDTEPETEWLKKCDAARSDADDEVRRKVARDIAEGK
jgi:uncharacterized protein (DUF924 family)